MIHTVIGIQLHVILEMYVTRLVPRAFFVYNLHFAEIGWAILSGYLLQRVGISLPAVCGFVEPYSGRFQPNVME